MEPYLLVEKVKMMSSSDFSNDKKDSGETWAPLVSKGLNKFDAETPVDKSEFEPEAEQAFSKLYGSDNATVKSAFGESFDTAVTPADKSEPEQAFSKLYGRDNATVKSAFGESFDTAVTTGVEKDTTFAPLYDPRAHEVKKPDPLPVPAFEAAEPQAFESGVAAESPSALPMPDVEAIEQQAYEEGYRKGEEMGYQAGEERGCEEGLQKSQQNISRVETLLVKLETLWEDMVRSHEGQIIDLVGKVAEKVVFARVALDNEIVRRTIMEAFELIPEPSEATITVNPDDYEFIEMVKEDFFKQIRGLKQVSVVSDPSVHLGDCRIETASGEVSTGVEKRLEAVIQSLKASRGQGA